MARVVHVISAAQHRNQIVAISHPKDLDRNPRSKLNGCSDSLLVATSLAQCVLVDSAILHDDDKILVGKFLEFIVHAPLGKHETRHTTIRSHFRTVDAGTRSVASPKPAGATLIKP